MIQSRQTLILVGCFTVLVSLLAACSSTQRASDGHTPEQQRAIAEACLVMLRSSLTNEMDIQPDDPRVPEIVRTLQPIDIQIQGTDVVIMRAGKPMEYHLSHRPSDAKPWVLYGAGQGYNGHQELIRLDHQ